MGNCCAARGDSQSHEFAKQICTQILQVLEAVLIDYILAKQNAQALVYIHVIKHTEEYFDADQKPAVPASGSVTQLVGNTEKLRIAKRRLMEECGMSTGIPSKSEKASPAALNELASLTRKYTKSLGEDSCIEVLAKAENNWEPFPQQFREEVSRICKVLNGIFADEWKLDIRLN